MRYVLLLLAIGVFLLLKFSYTIAQTEDLVFLLGPTNQLVELFTGLKSKYIFGQGFFYEQLNVVIDKSCSGFNFWALCFLMLSFLVIEHVSKSSHKIIGLFLSFAVAYVFTIFINGARIFASIVVERIIHLSFNINQELVHESIGVLTYLSFLIFIYFIAKITLSKRYKYEKFLKS